MKEALNCINLAVNFIAKAERQWHTRGFSCRLHVPVYMCMLYECAWDHLRVLVELCVVCCAVPPMRRRSMHGLAKNENNYTRYRYALYNIYVIRIYKADDNELICILRISSFFFSFCIQITALVDIVELKFQKFSIWTVVHLTYSLRTDIIP